MPTTRSASKVATTPGSHNDGPLPTRKRRRQTRQQAAQALASSTSDPVPSEPLLPPEEVSTAKPKAKPKRPPSSQSQSTRAQSKKSKMVKAESSPDVAVPVTPDNTSQLSTTTSSEHENAACLVPPTTPTIMQSIPTLQSTVTPSPTKSKATSPRQLAQHQRQPPKEDWESIYRLVEELRSDRTAPVDTDGSEALPQRDLGPQVYRFQVLIALMLSSQTKDAVVGDAMRQLQQHGLTVSNIRNTSFDTLNNLIFKVGFHNTKAKNILQVTEILDTTYGGDIPPTAQEMIDQLPGVGPKMAYIVENVAWGRQTGIGIDTHMHRMFNQLQWVNSKQPEQTRLQLESWLPPQYWPTVNLLWVGLGQEVQQYPEKLLRKAFHCSQPRQALKLLKRLGMDYTKVAAKMGWTTELQQILQED